MSATADSTSRNANRALAVVRGLDESRMSAAVVVLVAVGIVALNLYAPAQPTFPQRALASLLVAMCAVPSLMWVAKRQWPHSVMPYVGVLYAACFALPIFLKSSFVGAWLGVPKLDDAAIEGALVLAIAGWAALMIGHFAAPQKALSSEGQAPRAPRLKALPRIEVVAGGPRLAKALAAVAALVGVPCLYLDNTAVVARYTGETLLPDEVAFPVVFLGQLVVFAALVLFHLQMRSQLGVAGRVCLAVLALYYTVLGFSTGMANHGLKAVVGLFVAYAVVAHRPSWRFVVLAALVGAFLILVQLPSRYDYRRLLWTHGVEPAGVPPGLGHQLEPQGESWPAIETPAYSVMLSGPLQPEELVFAHKDPGVCRRVRPTPDFRAFVHVYPVDLDDLAYLRRPYGFDQADFTFKGGSVEDDRCVHRVPLPDYAIRSVRVGLFRIAVPASRPSYLPGRIELASDGEWRLLTLDEAAWRIDPSAGRNRLVVAVADEEQRRRMAMTGANNRIRVEIDERNWAEYVVSGLGFPNQPGQLGWRATYRLSEMRRSEGDRTALTEGAAATLRYEQAGPIVVALSYVGSPQGEGTNPAAPSASRSLASNTVVYLRSLGYGLGGDDVERRHRRTVDRFDRLLPVAWVMANTPARIPHLRGETLRPLLHKLAPRAVYEGKPGDAQYIGWRYGFVLAAEQTRNFKVHQLGEFYANFGVFGTIAGMLMLGLLYRAIHHLFHHRGASAATMAAGTHMLTVLMLEMESILSVSLGFVMWYAVVLAVLAVVVRIGRRCLGSSRAGG